MKRGGPLKRTELKRGASQLKRSPLKRQSKKRAKQSRAIGPIRKAFREEMGCVCGRVAIEVHEIWGGGVRFKTVELREFWLALCRKCHNEIQDSPKPFQYALKSMVDGYYYDLRALNEYAIGKVSESEVFSAREAVETWLKEIRK